MAQEDIQKLLELVGDARRWLNGNSNYATHSSENDFCVAGQLNTFRYVANSQETQKWADGVTQIQPVVNELKRKVVQLEDYINGTNQFLNYVEELAESFKNYRMEDEF